MPLREQEAYMSQLPQVNIPRSIFNRKFEHKTTFDVGELIPYNCVEVIPGSTHTFNTSAVIRLQTLKTPIMDQLYVDFYDFFVPNRLLMDHWKNFCGENDQGPWTRDKVNYRIPVLFYPEPNEDEGFAGGFEVGSIADHFGIPVGQYLSPPSYDDKNFPSALPFRAYALIVNEFFRSTPLQQPIVVHRDEVSRTGARIRDSVPTDNGSIPSYVVDLELGGKPFIAARFHDYFSSCLPQPQASQPISIFGGIANSDEGASTPWELNGPFSPVFTANPWTTPSKLDALSQNDKPYDLFGVIAGQNYTSRDVRYSNASDHLVLSIDNTNQSKTGFVPTNLWASLNVPEATINSLRLAFQLQRYYEKLGSGGQRYREYLKEFFGIDNGDARMQIPEYLGGHRVPLSIHQVANTSETESAALGDLGAMSNTSTNREHFTMSFSEHGYIIQLAVVRFDNTYSQGLERMWSRRDILDFYNPVFAHLSNQPVFAREISLGLGVDPSHPSPDPDRVFGYSEAWAEYRYPVSRCSGYMRPEVSQSLASWHLADDYQYAPYLSEDWIQTDKTTVDRVLDVTSQAAPQIWADFFTRDRAVMPMPMHSIPGLADHAW